MHNILMTRQTYTLQKVNTTEVRFLPHREHPVSENTVDPCVRDGILVEIRAWIV